MRRLFSHHRRVAVVACSSPSSVSSSCGSSGLSVAFQQRWGSNSSGGTTSSPPPTPPAPSWLANVLVQVASRLPAVGQGVLPVAAAQLRKLVEDRAPDPATARLDLNTLKDAVAARPDLFAIAAAADTGTHTSTMAWSVLRAAPSETASEEPSAPTNAPSGTTEPRAPAEKISAYAKQIKRAIRALQQQSRSRCSPNDATRGGDSDFVSLRHIAHRCNWTRREYDEVLRDVLPVLIGGGGSSAADSKEGTLTTKRLPFGIECKPSIRVKPHRRPRGFHVFTDADGLPKEDAQKMLRAMAVDQRLSTNVVVRHMSTGQHGTMDTVTPYGLPSHLVIEKEARMLSRSSGAVLKDVLFLCSDRMLCLYAEQLVPQLSFPRCNVFVCSPSRVVVVSTPAAAADDGSAAVPPDTPAAAQARSSSVTPATVAA